MNIKEQEFYNYILNMWCNKVIYTEKQKKEIISYINKIGIRHPKTKEKYTFDSLIEILKTKGFKILFEGKETKIEDKKLKRYIKKPINRKNINPYVIIEPKEMFEYYLDAMCGEALYPKQILYNLNHYFSPVEDIETIEEANKCLIDFNYKIVSTKLKDMGDQIFWRIKEK